MNKDESFRMPLHKAILSVQNFIRTQLRDFNHLTSEGIFDFVSLRYTKLKHNKNPVFSYFQAIQDFVLIGRGNGMTLNACNALITLEL